MEKLKKMDESGNRPSAGKIDELMENLVKTGCAVCHLLSPGTSIVFSCFSRKTFVCLRICKLIALLGEICKRREQESW